MDRDKFIDVRCIVFPRSYPGNPDTWDFQRLPFSPKKLAGRLLMSHNDQFLYIVHL